MQVLLNVAQLHHSVCHPPRHPQEQPNHRLVEPSIAERCVSRERSKLAT